MFKHFKQTAIDNWKTSLIGLTSMCAGFIAFSPEYFPKIVVNLALFINSGGAAYLGLTSWDSRRQAVESLSTHQKAVIIEDEEISKKLE